MVGPQPLVPTAPGVALPTWGQLHIDNAQVHYRDGLQELELQGQGSLHVGTPLPGAAATGRDSRSGAMIDRALVAKMTYLIAF